MQNIHRHYKVVTFARFFFKYQHRFIKSGKKLHIYKHSIERSHPKVFLYDYKTDKLW